MSSQISRLFHKSIEEHNRIFSTMEHFEKPFLAAANLACSVVAAGGRLLFCGNGGSAADAQHAAAELLGRLRRDRRALPAIALTADASLLTGIGNDWGFDAVFSRQVEALGAPGDLLIAISTSGRSRNVIVAVERAQALGIRTIVLVGKAGAKLAELAELALVVPSEETERIQEAQMFLLHCLCAAIEDSIDERCSTV